MSSVEEKNKKFKQSPTKQRTPRQLLGQKKVSIYFAQSKSTIDASSIITTSSESEQENDIITESNSVKKRKKNYNDQLTRKIIKIRKTFDDTFVNNETNDIFDSQDKDIETEQSPQKSSPKKVLENSLSSNIELTIKKDNISTDGDSNNKENVLDTQGTDTLDGFDDFFDEEWSYNKNTVEEFDDLFSEEWTLDKKTINFINPKRCTIIDIIWDKSEIILTVKDPDTEATATVKCQEIWRYTKLEPGESIIIKAKEDNLNTGHWIVDNNNGWIINQPDTLVSGTSVVGALFCNRRSALQEKFRFMENLPFNNVGNYFMLTGSLSHELLQTVLDKEIKDIKKISEILTDILTSRHAIEMMYSAGISLTECKNLMRPAVAQIYKFIQRYINDVEPDAPDQNFQGKIERICDIEENVWLPSLGLKGKIDLTVEVSTKSKNKLLPSVERKILPLEIKTGKASFSSEHRGQLMLYTMMMNMTGREVNSGLLLYLRENIMREVIGTHHTQRDLITLRNTVAYYLTRQPTIVKIKDESKILPMELPKVIDHSVCSKCPYNTLCSSYLTADDKNELHEGHKFKSISETVISHLSTEHIEYVQKWVSLIQLEELAQNQDSTSWKDVWNLQPPQREKRGSCISNLNLISVYEKYGRHFHEFQKLKNNESLNQIISTDFCIQDYVIISTNDRINICSGFIDTINKTSVTVSCDKNITRVYNKNLIFHIDKNTCVSLSTQNMSYLGGLLVDHEICDKLRKIIIERQPATFTTAIPDELFNVGEEILNNLNTKQKMAILKVFSANDYLLIKGFPGTGKTQTIVAMIELLVKLDKSVLVTANTNVAVDNILLKLLDRKIDFMRLGSTAKVHSALHHTLDQNLTANCDSPESLHTVYCSKKIIGVTCYGSSHSHLSRRKFDVCIVDESTQVQQVTILGPLFCASKFILVGDPEQLPPIAKDYNARKLGVSESLFSRLDTENNVVTLTSQYRMNKNIMDLANKLTYHNKLEMGSDEVGNATLPVSNIAIFESCEKWIRKTLSLRPKYSTIMLNTSATHHLSLGPSLEHTKRNTNYWEVAIIIRLIEVLKHLGIDTKSIGVIAPYRTQVNLLRMKILDEIEINTVDQYQGRDKSIILYSCTKSIQPEIDIGEYDILNDHQRLTVAVTRAKHKLILIGDLNTLQRFTPFNKLINILKNRDHIYDLKDNEDDFSFDELIQLVV